MKQEAKELGLSLYLGLLSNIFFLRCSCMYLFIPLQPYEMSTVLEQLALPVKKKYMHWVSFMQQRDQALLLPLLS